MKDNEEMNRNGRMSEKKTVKKKKYIIKRKNRG